MRRFMWIVVGAALVVGCEKEHAKAPPQPRPAGLVVDFARASSSSMDGVKAYLGAVKPMLAMAMDESVMLGSVTRSFGLASVDGLDRSQPLHILVVDDSAAEGVALLAKVGDAKKLDAGKGTATIEQRDGWAVIGREPVVKYISGYALSTLVDQAAPAKPTATIYVSKVAAKHPDIFTNIRAQLARNGAGPQFTGMMTGYIDGLESVAKETSELRVTLDAGAPQLQLDFDMTPEPNSRFAQFVAAQQPSDFALLGKLPESTPAILFAGHMAGGPYHEGLVALMTQMYSADASATKELASLIEGTTGDLAFAMDLAKDGMQMTQLVGIADDAKTGAALANLKAAFTEARTIDMGNMIATYQTDATATDHGNVGVYGFATTYSPGARQAAAAQQVISRMTANGVQRIRLAAFDHLMVTAMAGDGEAAIGRAIDAVRGGTHLAIVPEAAPLVDAARTRKDSMLMLLDLGFVRRMMGLSAPAAPTLMSFGVAGGHATAHIVVPAKSVAAVL